MNITYIRRTTTHHSKFQVGINREQLQQYTRWAMWRISIYVL